MPHIVFHNGQMYVVNDGEQTQDPNILNMVFLPRQGQWVFEEKYEEEICQNTPVLDSLPSTESETK
jgi:hypothetical protein